MSVSTLSPARVADRVRRDVIASLGFLSDAASAANSALVEGLATRDAATALWDQIRAEGQDEGEAGTLARRAANRVRRAGDDMLGLATASAGSLYILAEDGRVLQVTGTTHGSQWIDSYREVFHFRGEFQDDTRDREDFPVEDVIAFTDTPAEAYALRARLDAWSE